MEKRGNRRDPGREVRVALVLYGGVSLAIYENGVTRAFWDLVKASAGCKTEAEIKNRGCFHLLLELLDARAVVDVVAGTSAGGINGLLLGAALEAGSDFSRTSKLWREHGDFGKLLRPVPSRKDYVMESLLSDSYYLGQLQTAFDELFSYPPESAAYESELDIYITGTDFEGYVNSYLDFLGNRIEDKEYRTVFQLKYRPGRRFLGLANTERKTTAENRKKQSWILASLARITSSFPAAFPPFHVDKVEKSYREEVRTSLTRITRTENTEKRQAGSRSYVDGGVLDNKPFGPALEAVFYRMPKGQVDRRLFYVEPDPQHFTETAGGVVRQYNPLGVAMACLTTIPSHESISGDLRELKKHNARVRWLNSQRDHLLGRYESGELNGVSRTGLRQYREIRLDSLARALLAESEVITSAVSEIHGTGPGQLYEETGRLLGEMGKLSVDSLSSDDDNAGYLAIDRYDVDLHLRLNFQRLKVISRELDREDEANETLRTAITAVGRVIKFLKLVRNAFLLMRQQEIRRAVREIKGGGDPGNTAAAFLNAFHSFLESENSRWTALCADLKKCVSLEMLADRRNGPFASERLSALLYELRRSSTSAGESHQDSEEADGGTILEILSGVVDRLLGESDLSGSLKKRLTFRALQEVDMVLFPLHFFSGIHELDEVEFARVGPKDAQLGLSRLKAEEKVTGDELAHFASFFRQDWRSNDILWGRLDAICQIIQSLLDPDAMERILRRKAACDGLFTVDMLRRRFFPDCPEENLVGLSEAWSSLNTDNVRGEQGRLFKERFIEAAQHQAACQDLEEVVADRKYQEIAFGRLQGPCGENTASDPGDIRAAAREMAAKEVARLESGKVSRGAEFKSMRIGLQTVFGVNSRVPLNILGEYCSQAFLIVWGMLRLAVGSREAGGIFDNKIFRLAIWHPVRFSYRIINLMRTQQNTAPLVLVAVAAALATATVISLFAGIGWSLAAIGADFLFWVIIDNFCPDICRRKWGSLRWWLKCAMLLAVIAGIMGMLIPLFH